MLAVDIGSAATDVGYTMVIFTGLADRLAVRTPVMDAIIKITSVVPGRDLCGKGAHTMKTLGLHEVSIEQLRICDQLTIHESGR